MCILVLCIKISSKKVKQLNVPQIVFFDFALNNPTHTTSIRKKKCTKADFLGPAMLFFRVNSKLKMVVCPDSNQVCGFSKNLKAMRLNT